MQVRVSNGEIQCHRVGISAAVAAGLNGADAGLGPPGSCRGAGWVVHGRCMERNARRGRVGRGRETAPILVRSRGCLAGGRYWIRTSDPFGVNEVRYRCANRPLREETLATTGRIAKSAVPGMDRVGAAVRSHAATSPPTPHREVDGEKKRQAIGVETPAWRLDLEFCIRLARVPDRAAGKPAGHRWIDGSSRLCRGDAESLLRTWLSW